MKTHVEMKREPTYFGQRCKELVGIAVYAGL
jgi:hypothetical protein